MRHLRFILAIVTCGLLLPAGATRAQSNIQQSECLAMAQSIPGVMFARAFLSEVDTGSHEENASNKKIEPPLRFNWNRGSILTNAAVEKSHVTITYAGHSTYLIETPGHVTIATDFSGAYTAGKVPNVATMNRAHSTHYTLRPDPRITHILHGWGSDGVPARHQLAVGDVLIRNVTTDIRGYSFGSDSVMQKDGNSIFIFEVAGLCIGHLGHLHHLLDDSHYAAIGRLDIVMVPIDGGLTMSLNGMSDITRRLRSSIVLPMHRFSTPLDDFVARMKGEYEVDIRPERSFVVSRQTLPKKPTVILLDGV